MGFVCCRAYGPGEVKVLVSGDGGNFAEAACWRSASRSEVSYEDVIMFDGPQMVKSLTIVMKAPMPWGYFGLNDVSLLTSGDESFMFVSGRTSSEGEQCLIASGLELGAAACLDAVAAGDGREVFAFRGEQLMHTASSLCVAVPSAESKRVVLQNCKSLAKANDGRGAFELAPHGQLKMPRSGNSCIVLVDGRPVVRDCSEASRLGDASDQFAMAAVPEVDVQAASSARMGAALLSAATSRQRSALNRLEELLPSLGTCRFAAVAHNSSRLLKQASFMRSRQDVREPLGLPADAAWAAVNKIYESIGADIDGSLQLIHDSTTVLAAAHSKLTRSA